MSEWCFLCGVESKPERAIGWDEDGEPACALHSVKAKKPLNIEQSHGRVPEQVAEKSSPTIPAAPSPVQIKQEKEMAYNEKKCLGCGLEFIPSGPRAERCEECRKARSAERAKKYRTATAAVTLKPAKKPRNVVREPKPSPDERIDRLTDHVNREIGVAQDVPLHLRVDVGGGDLQACATTERLITLQLGESKVQKLLNLLLRD